MLRAGPSSAVVQGPIDPPPDLRQGMLDLDPATTDAEQMITRLAYENARLISRLHRAGLPTAIEDPTDRVRYTDNGRNSKPDPIAQLAASFAKQVMKLTSVQTDHPGEEDAAAVNDSIAMIATEADGLMTAVIKDAEAHGLEASGPWLKIPLVETQSFEVATPDPAADEADDLRDWKLNS